jgi:hypothetical protein
VTSGEDGTALAAGWITLGPDNDFDFVFSGRPTFSGFVPEKVGHPSFMPPTSNRVSTACRKSAYS